MKAQRKVFRTVDVMLVVSTLVFMVPTVASADTPDLAAIDAYVQEQMQANQIVGLALGIVRDNQIVHLRGFGVADPSGRLVTPQTPFIIGSNTKSFTGLAVMQLVEQGKIDLDAPVQHYIPWFRVADAEASARITVRHLLNHTSGISSYEDRLLLVPTDADTVEAHVREMSGLSLTQPPGSKVQYTSWNYLVLGSLVEAVSGQSYAGYVQQHIFTPLSMGSSFTAVADARQHDMASGYQWWFGFPVRAREPYRADLLPVGYLISSAEDMAHYLVAHLNEGRFGSASILSPAGIAQLGRPSGTGTAQSDYAMGWATGLTAGIPTLSHSGETPTFMTDMILAPEEGWGIVVLMNTDSLLAPSLVTPIAPGVLSLLLGQQPAAASRFRTAYLIVDAAVALLTALVILSLARVARWRWGLLSRRPRGVLAWLWRVVLPIAGDLILPFVLLVFIPAGSGMPFWRVMTLWLPDLSYWALAIALVLLAKGFARGGLAVSAARMVDKA